MDFYKRLLRLSRRRERDSPVPALLDHLRRQKRPALRADAAVGHLAAADAVQRRDLPAALARAVKAPDGDLTSSSEKNSNE